MSTDRTRVRASSIVGLYRDETIESLPIEEVTADLDRLGIDPVPSIELAKRLADGNADDPATALLRRLEVAEEIEAEIANLESAPIDEIRSILPEGVAEEVAAEAKERSVEDEEDETEVTTSMADDAAVVPIKRRRFAVLGWGGSLVGVAASVALFVAVRPDLLEEVEWANGLKSSIEHRLSTEEAEPPLPGDVADQAGKAELADVSAVEAETSPSTVVRSRRQRPDEAAGSPVTDQQDIALEALVAQAHREAAAAVGETPEPTATDPEERSGLLPAERATPAPSDDAVAAVRQALSDAATNDTAGEDQPPPAPAAEPERGRAAETPSHLPAAKPTPVARELAALLKADVSARQPIADSAEEDVPDVAGIPGLPDDLTGVFIVDAESLPATLAALADVEPDNRLAAKAGEASLRALGRKLLALIAFDQDGQRVEAALVKRPAAAPPADLAAEAAIGVTAFAGGGGVPSLAGSERSFELIELPGDR